MAAIADRAGRGGIPVTRERGDEGVGAGVGLAARSGDGRGIPALGGGEPLTGEGLDGVLADGVAQIAQGVRRQVVIVGRQRGVTGVGSHPAACRAAATAGAGGPEVVARRDGTLLGERVEMPTHGRGREPELAADRGGRDGAVLGDGREHPGPRARVVLSGFVAPGRDIHNVSMS